uniref:MADF domain-containing protein n=1 Tax=Glossina austeni TaxID=7395 RepID=A0A1A9VQ33_GLOAU
MSNDHYGCLNDSAMAAISSASSSNPCISTRWLTEEVFALIDLVQRNEAIYNPRHKYYFCRPYVENFWREVDLKLEKNLGASLAKWTNLRISFRREYTNYLEEKVPPCWTYFDRMFFLHPYLRKKHQQSKSLDSQVQDTLVQISTLSDRLQRERAAAAASLSNGSASGDQNVNSPRSNVPPNQVDSYLEYLDEGEPNASELDDMTDDEPINVRSYAHDIKSECEDNVDDFDPDSRQHIDDEQEGENDDHDMRNFMLHTVGKQYQQQQRLQHLQRLQTRTFYEDFRNKRAKSHDNVTNPPLTTTHNSAPTSLSSNSVSNHTTNVSFVRPTFSKASENVNTSAHNTANLNNSANSNTTNELESIPNSTTARPNSLHYHSYGPHNQYQHHHHTRFEMPGMSNASNGTGNTTVSNANLSVTPELCDCKTDPDAMFLMSLLPDIQKLNGRDRGKIKIAFQNILQDYLYPD